MTAFVLGNGRSRAEIDVNQLMQIGSVYGCNALYRSHKPTVLVATDRAISEDIQRSGYALANRFYTRRPMPDLGALTIPKDYFGFSSGPAALAIASLDRHQKIYLLGFDMGPSETGRFNNIYADSTHYKQSQDAPTYTGNWARQIQGIARGLPQIKFVRVHGSTTANIPEFDKIPNFSKMDLADFVERINNAKDL